MTTTITTTNELPQLAADINAAHDACYAAVDRGLTFAREAGEKLIEAKRLLPYGEFTPWIERECRFVPRTAQHYMRIARNWPAIEAARAERGSVLCLTDARNLLSEPAKTGDRAGGGDRKPEPDRESRRELCALWWDQLSKYAVLLDAAGYSAAEVADYVGMPERDVRLVLEPEIPTRFDTPENGIFVPRHVQHAYAVEIERLGTQWIWTAYTNARFYAERFGAFGEDVTAEMRAMERQYERRYRRAVERSRSERSAFWDTGYAAGLWCGVCDDARVAYGIDPGPITPLLELFAKAEHAIGETKA